MRAHTHMKTKDKKQRLGCKKSEVGSEASYIRRTFIIYPSSNVTSQI